MKFLNLILNVFILFYIANIQPKITNLDKKHQGILEAFYQHLIVISTDSKLNRVLL